MYNQLPRLVTGLLGKRVGAIVTGHGWSSWRGGKGRLHSHRRRGVKADNERADTHNNEDQNEQAKEQNASKFHDRAPSRRRRTQKDERGTAARPLPTMIFSEKPSRVN